MRNLSLLAARSAILIAIAANVSFAQDAAATPDAATPDAATPDAATPDAATPDAAGQNAASPETLALVESLRGGYQPISTELIASVKRDLLSAVSLSSSWLNSISADRRSEWTDHLSWDSFTKLVREDSPDLGLLNRTLVALYEDREGLEASHWLDLRSKLERYMYLSQYAGDANAEKLYDARVDALAKAIGEAGEVPRGDQAHQIGRVLGLFDRYEQQPETVSKIRSHYLQPNLVATISARLASRAAARQINRTLPVNDVILGTTIRGTAQTSGNISIRLLPNSTKIAAQVQLTGTALSTNTGWNRGVQVNSRGTTSIDARKVVYVDRHGIVTNAASAECSTQSQIDAICHDRKLVRKIAWKKACESKAQAECIANGRAEARIRQELDSEVSQMVAENRVKFEKDVRAPIMRRNAMPRQLITSSDSERIWVRLLQASSFQLAAASTAPSALPTTDVAIQLHESLVANLSESLIGGVTLTDEDLAKKIEEAGREVPDELKIRDDTDPWSITFSTSRPISVSLDKETVKIVVRGARFTRGASTVTRDMEISARYNMSRSGAGLRLVRDGEVDASYVKQGAEGFGDIAIKTLMRTKFSALFKEEIESSGIPLPGPLEGKAELQLASFEAGDGWAVVGWNLVDVVAATTAALSSNH